MKVQQATNTQTTFGMALKVKRSAMKSIIKEAKQGQFIRVLPELKTIAKHTDVTIWAPWSGSTLFFDATPKNKLGINNEITREIYEACKKYGLSILDLKSESTFVTHAKEAVKELEQNKKTDTYVKKEAHSFIKKLQEQM